MEREMLKMEQREQAELEVFKAREQEEARRKARDALIWQDKQRVKQQRMLEKLRVEQEFHKRMADAAELKRR